MGETEGWKYGGWQRVPFWHPRRWFGYSWREWQYDAYTMMAEYDGQWVYQTHEQRARQILEEAYANQ